jgi:hypothetical protein
VEDFLSRILSKISTEAGLFDCALLIAVYYLHKDRARVLLESKETMQTVITALRDNTKANVELKEKLAYISGSVSSQHNDK